MTLKLSPDWVHPHTQPALFGVLFLNYLLSAILGQKTWLSQDIFLFSGSGKSNHPTTPNYRLMWASLPIRL